MSSLDITSLLRTPKLSSYLELVNEGLVKATISGNPSINKPASRLVKAKGKRLRPALLIAVAVSQGKEIDDTIISACCAVELAHIGSLVHDDIIDNADTRWNSPTINSSEGSNNAIVVGDYFLAKACSEGAKVSAAVADKVAVTITELCDGQSRELADQHNLGRTKEAYLKSIKGKTASLISAACEIGGICSGLDDQKVRSLALYGENFGISFQLIDDLIDMLSTSELLGKPVGNDVREGVYTLPVIFALSGPYKDAVQQKLADKQNIVLSDLVGILLKDSSVERSITLARKYNQLAVDALYDLEGNTMISSLLSLPDNYLNWCLRNLVAKTYIPDISNL